MEEGREEQNTWEREGKTGGVERKKLKERRRLGTWREKEWKYAGKIEVVNLEDRK